MYFWIQLNKIQATDQPPDHQACQLTSSHDQIINFQIPNLLSTEIDKGSMSTKRAWARTGWSNQGLGFENLHKGEDSEKKRNNYLVKYKKLAIRRLCWTWITWNINVQFHLGLYLDTKFKTIMDEVGVRLPILKSKEILTRFQLIRKH